MNFPIQGGTSLVLALVFGAIFGVLLQRGHVVNYNTIVNQFRFKDFTVLKVMLTAILVGGVGVLALKYYGLASYHVKPADMLAVVLGAALFGIGMVLYGYCPGTGIAAVGSGSIHALVGAFGMIAGGMLYAFSFDWLKEHVMSVASYGKIRLPDITGVADVVWFAVLGIIAIVVFSLIRRWEAVTN